MNLTAVVLTRNNQKTLHHTLASLSWAPNILIIDDYSTDKTLSIAKKHQAKIFKHHLNQNWAAQRNFALKQVTTKWTLFIDSDEILTPALARQIKTALRSANVGGFYLKRSDIFLNHPLHHTEAANIKLLRLARTKAGSWNRSVHEVWQIKGKTKTLSSPLLHQRQHTISQFFSKLTHYAIIDSQSLIKENKPFSSLQLIKPFLKFLYNYIFLLGFLDGYPGLFFSYLMSLNSLSTRVFTWHEEKK